MPIDATAANSFVESEGELVTHHVGTRCPCHDDDGQADPNCTLHELGGWLFDAGNNITGLVTAISSHKDWLESGVALPGDCVFSPLTSDTISEGDKIIFSWPVPQGQGEPLKRGAGSSDLLYYSATDAIICIDENRVKYRQNVDFQLVGRQIVWNWQGKSQTATAPSLGTKYSIKYKGLVEWIAMEPPATRISHGDDIGSRVLLRKKHIFEQ